MLQRYRSRSHFPDLSYLDAEKRSSQLPGTSMILTWISAVIIPRKLVWAHKKSLATCVDSPDVSFNLSIRPLYRLCYAVSAVLIPLHDMRWLRFEPEVAFLDLEFSLPLPAGLS